MHQGGAMPEKDAGWGEDGMKDGEIILNMREGKPQLLVRSATGMQDVESDQGTIYLRHRDQPGMTVLLVIYPLATEQYMFRLDKQGNGEVSWSGARWISQHGWFDRHMLFVAKCFAP
jgi:hypothetical protein